MMHRLATTNAPIVTGIRRPSPPSSLTSVLCAATSTAPAQKNSVIFPKACITMCSAAPTVPHALASTAPSTT